MNMIHHSKNGYSSSFIARRYSQSLVTMINSAVWCRGNQAKPDHPPKFAQHHFYKKGQQGAVSIVCNLKDFTSNSFHMTKEDCSLLSPSVEMVLSKLRRVSGICLGLLYLKIYIYLLDILRHHIMCQALHYLLVPIRRLPQDIHLLQRLFGLPGT